MQRICLVAILTAGSLAVSGASAHAHCQIPCGIFDESIRLAELREDTTTIQKSIQEIIALSPKKDAQSINQRVRWVNNKEQHAERIMRTMADYFFAQKIKPTDKDYRKRLADHHAVMLAAMVCKQKADLACVKPLRQAINGIEGYWHTGATP